MRKEEEGGRGGRKRKEEEGGRKRRKEEEGKHGCNPSKEKKNQKSAEGQIFFFLPFSQIF